MSVDSIWDLIGNILIGLSVGFMAFGAVALFRFKDFYMRVLMASKIDTVGVVTLILGFAFRNGISFFTGKLVLIMVIMLVLNPLVAYVTARSAYFSDKRSKEEKPMETDGNTEQKEG